MAAPPPHPDELSGLVERARAGDAGALDALIRAVEGDVYNLSVRMLWHPAEPQDASQEILLKVVTHLANFRGESAFRTWVFRVATNYLLSVRRSRAEREELTFARFGEQLAEGLSEPPASAASDPDQALLVDEVKIGCTQGMLLCLDRGHRLAYVLGDLFGLESGLAAEVLEITPAAFRKRLSRARSHLRAFMRVHCGLVSEYAACRCARRVQRAVEVGRVTPGALLFAGRNERRPRALPVLEEVREMEELHDVAAIYRSHPDYAAPERLLEGVRRLVRTRRYRVL